MRFTTEQKIYYTLRVVVVMCFIGHGAFGIITKAIWCNYFGVFGIDKAMAYRMMPWIGSLDILLGILMLFYPMRAILLWLVVWGTLTASLRPLSGEPMAELIERAGNFGAPLALLLLTGGIEKYGRNLFYRLDPVKDPHAGSLRQVSILLRIIVFLLLLGHAWLNLTGKKGLIGQYSSLGFANPAKTALAIGLFEMSAALMILIRPLRPLLFIVFIWKVFSELFYPHFGLFEWIERGGSYGALLALWFVTDAVPSSFIGNSVRDLRWFGRKWPEAESKHLGR